MEDFKVVIFIMVIFVALSAFADKTKLPAPIVMVFAGLIIGFVPYLPDLSMDPVIVFLIFLPPLLYDAASKTSWHEFRQSIRPISALAITLVFFTTLAVAVSAHCLIPGFTWPLSFVLGAIVSPPDAVAATSITKGMGLNKRVITILEGESLLNDASALVAYRYAVAAVTTGTFVLWRAGLEFLMVAGCGILTGVVSGYVFVFVHKKIKSNPVVETSLTLLYPFVSYLLAERFKVSGVLAVVSTGLMMSWRAPEIFSYQARMRTRIVWDTMIYLLNGFIFILIGLQLPAIIKDLGNFPVLNLLGEGLLISLATIIVRIVWVFGSVYGLKLFKTKNIEGPGSDHIQWKNVLIVAWTGTRGIISLATALALPLTLSNGNYFPRRHSIIFLAFVVIFVTLVVQGLTLPLLIRLLDVKPDNNDDNEEKELKLFLADSTLHFIDNEFSVDIDNKTKDRLRKKYEMEISTLNKELRADKKRIIANEDMAPVPLTPLLNARLEISKFQREMIIKLHKEGNYSDTVLKKIEFEKDIDDVKLDLKIPKDEE